MSFGKLLIIFLIAIGISFGLYGNTISGDFVYDDLIFVDRKELKSLYFVPQLFSKSTLPEYPNLGIYRPLTSATFVLSFTLFGEFAQSFHIVNIILNGIAIFLVYLVTLRLFKNSLLAIFTALIFAFLPIHTEAVASIKSRDEILSSIFMLLSLFIFTKTTEEKKVNYPLVFLASFLGILAALAKEFAVMAPVLLFALFWIKEKPSLTVLFRFGLSLVPASILYLILRWQALGEYAFGKQDAFWYYAPMHAADITTRVWTAFKMLFMYIQKTFIPQDLSATYNYNHLTLVDNPVSSWEVLLGVVSFLILLVLIFNKRIRSSPFPIGAVLFIVPYFIISKFLFTSGEIFAERWMYFPSFGLSIIAGFALFKIYKLKKWALILSLAFIIPFYGFITVQRNTVWLSEKNLYESMVKDAPKSAQGYIGLANLYFKQNNREESERYLRLGQEIYHDHPKFLDLEIAFAKQDKDYLRAKKALAKFLEIAPNADKYIDYASILIEEEEYEKSIEILQKYFSSKHYKPNTQRGSIARSLMAFSLIRLGRVNEAKVYEQINLRY